MGSSGATSSGICGAGVLNKKLVLWLVVLLQLGVIGSYWLLQQATSNMQLEEQQLVMNEVGAEGVGSLSLTNSSSLRQKTKERSKSKDRVQFIAYRNRSKQTAAAGLYRRRYQLSLVNKFEDDFFKLDTKRLNLSEAETEMSANAEMEASFYCFREGTSNETHLSYAPEDVAGNWQMEADFECVCLPEWHGKQCAQPELIYRSLMTSKNLLTLKAQLGNAGKSEINRLFYLLQGSFHSLDLLELQVGMLKQVVDFYFVYHCNGNDSKQHKELAHRLKTSLSPLQHNYLLVDGAADNCSFSAAFASMQQHLKALQLPLKAQDLLLYTQDRELIAAKALKYLKYYAESVPALSFRLKSLNYGFFWQHPELTQRSAFLSSFDQVKPQSIGYAAARTIGDLNHFGGWHCQYCQHPEEIIAELQTSKKANLSAKIAKIDAIYVKQLIANGLQLEDGKTQLMRARTYTDKYFA